MKPLIRNQRIRIDSHQWGDGRPMDISAVHIHKSTKQPIPINGKRQHVEIEIPLTEDAAPYIYTPQKELDKIPRQLKEEIEEALRNPKRLIEFAKEVAQTLSNYYELTEMQLFEALKRVASCAGIKWDAEDIHSIYDGVWSNIYHLQLHDTEDHKWYCLTLNGRGLQIEDTLHDEPIDYYKPRFIIANVGSSYRGKSTTIKATFFELQRRGYVCRFLKGDAESEDIKGIVKVENVLVGVESQGDPDSRMTESLEDFEQMGCQIILTASRTRNDTYNKIFDMRYWYNYEVILAPNPRPYYYHPMYQQGLQVNLWSELHAKELATIIEQLASIC